MKGQTSEVEDAGILRRDEFTCQACGAIGGPRGSAQLRVAHLVPAEAGGSGHEANLLTLCHGCHAIVEGDRPLDSASPYLARYRELVDRVAVGQGAAEGFVACCRGLLSEPAEGRESYREARRELRQQCDRIEAAIEAVRALPPLEWPISEDLRTTHEDCLDLWERWIDLSRTLTDRVEELFSAANSGTYECPECGAGIWLDDEFCRACGADVDVRAHLDEDLRELRRELVRFAISLDD